MSISRRRMFTVAMVTAGLALGACGGGSEAGDSAECEEVDQIRVATGSPSVTLFPSEWIAEPLGYYAEECLEVEVISQMAGGTQQQALITGDLDFAGVGADTIIPLMADSEIPPFKLVHHDTLWMDMLMVLESSPYMTAEDLRGKMIGIPEAKDEVIAGFLMSAGGVEPGAYETLVVGARAPAAVAMDRGDTDAFAGTFVDLHAIPAAGYPLRVIETGGLENFHNTGIGATAEMIENDPDLVIRYNRAIVKAWIWAMENQEATLELLEEVVPEGVQDKEQSLLFLEAVAALDQPLYEARGQADPELWQAAVDKFAELGTIEETYDASKLYTNDLHDEIWDFDVDAVVEAARAGEWQP